MDYSEQVSSLIGTIFLGYEVEGDGLGFLLEAPSRAEVEWLAAWIVSEGWRRPAGWLKET